MTARVAMKIRKKKARSLSAAEAFFKALGYKTPAAKKTKRVVPPLVAFVVDDLCKCLVCRAQRRTIGRNN